MMSVRRTRADLRQFVSGTVPESRVAFANDENSISIEMSTVTERGLVARGSGFNYGDAADNTGGVVVKLPRSGTLEMSADGVLTVGGGVTLGRVLETVHPLGWTLPVLPATRHVTVGGAIAADVHGKNHSRTGSFGSHVRAMTLVTPVGVMSLSRDSDPELMDATCGGMGLTGVVHDARLQLRPAETSWLVSRQRPRGSMDDILHDMRESDAEYRIAWVDAFARGASRRGIVVHADTASVEEVPASDRSDPRTIEWRSIGRVPVRGVPRLLHDPTVRMFNGLWCRRASRRTDQRLVRMDVVLTPLDVLDGWNRLYGGRGFIQYQFAVPDEGEWFLGHCLERLERADCRSYFTTIKRLGPSTGRFLSFARAGWSLSLDIPRGNPALMRTLGELDRELISAGGRLYLAKDSRAAPETIEAMYPDLARFRRVRRTVDPEGHIQSDMGRRLRLSG